MKLGRQHTIPCKECRDPFLAVRRDARFCSALCRQRARRKRLTEDPDCAVVSDSEFDELRAAVASCRGGETTTR